MAINLIATKLSYHGNQSALPIPSTTLAPKLNMSSTHRVQKVMLQPIVRKKCFEMVLIF